MSWDVIITKASVAEAANYTPDFEPVIMGGAQEIRDMISAAVPEIDWSDPSNGAVGSEGFDMLFNISHDEAVETVDLEIRGNGDPLPMIVHLCKANNWAAFDMTTAEWLDLDNPSRDGWSSFQESVQQVKGRIENPDKKWWQFWKCQ